MAEDAKKIPDIYLPGYESLKTTYYACFGRGDYGNDCEWELTFDQEQAKIVLYAIMTRKSLEGFEEIKKVIEAAESEIPEYEVDEYELDDDVLESMGRKTILEDDMFEMLKAKDERALKYCNISTEQVEKLDEDELYSLMMDNVPDMPTMVEFDENFEPEYPYSITVREPEPEQPPEEDIRAYLKKAFELKDYELVDEVVKAQLDCFRNEIEWDLVARQIARECGCDDYASR